MFWTTKLQLKYCNVNWSQSFTPEKNHLFPKYIHMLFWWHIFLFYDVCCMFWDGKQNAIDWWEKWLSKCGTRGNKTGGSYICVWAFQILSEEHSSSLSTGVQWQTLRFSIFHNVPQTLIWRFFFLSLYLVLERKKKKQNTQHKTLIMVSQLPPFLLHVGEIEVARK